MSIEAHTDGSGSTARNLLLSQARADLVRSALVDRGVAADRLSATGLGESQPVASDSSNGGRARNRRVEIHVRA